MFGKSHIKRRTCWNKVLVTGALGAVLWTNHALAEINVTGPGNREVAGKIDSPCLNVFVPTTPNPTSGYYLVVPATEVIDVNLTVEEAFTQIISCGIAAPPENPLSA